MAAPRIMLDPDHPCAGLGGLDGQRRTRDQAAARERHQHHLELGALLDELEAEGTLAGNDIGMIEGRQHSKPLLGHEPLNLSLRIVLRPADDADLRPQPADAFDLVAENELRHAHYAAHTHGVGSVSQRAAVIAGGGRDHAAGSGVVRQRQ
jgi:hypothetical protein